MTTLTGGSASARAAAIAERCERARWHGDYWKACCPSHYDTNPSLSITPKADNVRLHCFAGCQAEQIVTALGLTMADLFEDQPSSNGHKRIVKVYDYLDANGHLLHQTVRFDPKDFKQRRPDPVNPRNYIWKLTGITPVLYHLPQVLQAIQAGETIHLCEGEKDADNLMALGLTATTRPMGAKYWQLAFGDTLTDADVVMWPDNDERGQAAIPVVQRGLAGKAKRLRIMTVPAPRKDITDWVQAGATRAELDALVEAWAPPVAQDAEASHATATQAAAPAWHVELLRNKGGEAQQTINNFVVAIQHLEPWKSAGCWYDSVRERHMVGDKPVEDRDATAAGIVIEQDTAMRVTNLKLVGHALDHVCRQKTRDLLQEWAATLPTAPVSDLLTTWLRTYAHVPDVVSDAYVADVSRLIPVAMLARILNPGCQFRYVPILEGPEEAGKSKLTKVLAGHDP